MSLKFESCLAINLLDRTSDKAVGVRTHMLEARPRFYLAQGYKNIEGEHQWLHLSQRLQRGSVASTFDLCDGGCFVIYRVVASIQFDD